MHRTPVAIPYPAHTVSDLSREACIHHLVEAVGDHLMFVVDAGGTIVFANAGAELAFGYAPSELVGLPLSVVFTEEDCALGVDAEEFSTAAKNGKAIDERWHRRKDGSRFWASGTLRALRRPDGALVGFTKICMDQTARKRTDDELRASNAELASFAHRTAHDLQEPLRTIAASASMLLKTCTHCAGQRYVQFVREAARRMSTSIQGILRHAELEKRHETVRDDVEMNLVFDAAVANLREAMRGSDALVTRAPLPLVRGAPYQILSLLQNLIGNALKYRGTEKPRIFVSATLKGAWWEIAVRDNGIGVAADDLERIFEPFERGAASGSAVAGTGLGLSYCRGVVAEHGGRIWMESEPGRGSTVRFTLPAH